MNASDSFFDSGRRPPKSDASRPRAVNPLTGQEQSWQQASNYASPLDNPHGLITYKLRELVRGLSMRPDLARLLLTGAVLDGDDKNKIDEIIAAAHATAEIDAKANEGTAVHAALSRAFLGHEVPVEYSQHVTAFAAELKRNGLTPVATEVTTLCVVLGVIGHTDWIVRTSDGRHLILDVKTGKLGDAKRKFAVQCKAYAGSEYIDDGKGGWTPIPFALDQTEAILAHVDYQTGATALYRVDLMLGFYGARLAESVRNWHKIEVLSPYTPVHPSIPTIGALRQTNPVPAVSSGTVVQQLPSPAAQTIAQSEIVYGVTEPDFECRFDGRPASAHPINVPGQFHCMEPQPRDKQTGGAVTAGPTLVSEIGHPVALGVDPQGGAVVAAQLQPDGTTHLNTVAVAERPAAITPMEMILGATSLQTLDMAWRRVTQNGEHPDWWTAEFQAARDAKAAELTPQPATPAGGPISADVDRSGSWTLDDLMVPRNTKPVLQKMAKDRGCTDLAHDRKWLALWIIATEAGADQAQAARYAKSKGTIPINTQTAVSAGAAVLAPTHAESTPFALKHISEAPTVEDIERFRANIVERSGDQAWTDEMAAAAQYRVAELAANSQGAAYLEQASTILDRVSGATTPKDIADLWSEATLGGSAPELWTPAIRAAADTRLATIQASQPPPTANPYGPQQ